MFVHFLENKKLHLEDTQESFFWNHFFGTPKLRTNDDPSESFQQNLLYWPRLFK